MSTLLDRYRRWYDYERDCNATDARYAQSVLPRN